MVYFQPYSNTYAPLDHLKMRYEVALSRPGVIGLVIGTRPDCIDEEKLNYLSELNKKHYIVVEYGVESIYNQTLDRINRLHSFEESEKAIRMTAKLGLHVGAHFIFGLPGESRKMMKDAVNVINKLPLSGIKFHQLQIVSGTQMALDYKKHPTDYDLFSLNDYVGFIVDFSEKLNPGFIIERFAGEVPPRFLAGPGWGALRNDQINLLIEKEFETRNSWQGKFFNAQCKWKKIVFSCCSHP